MDDLELRTLDKEQLIQLAAKYGVATDKKLTQVVLDALVVMKIVKHCKDNLPELVTGQLLGLDVDETLEVTNCFPFPSRGGEDSDEEEDEMGAEYQMEMMRGLREVNVDYNTVGWYTSSYCSFLSEGLLSDQFNYQTTISKCVVVVYDPIKINRGEISFKAFRLSDTFMELYKNHSFTQESISKANLSFASIFEEIPIKLNTPPLLQAFLLEYSDNTRLMGSGFVQHFSNQN